MAADIHKLLEELFAKSQEFFLSGKEICRRLPADLRRELGIDRKGMGHTEIVSKLASHFGTGFRELKKRNTRGVGYNISNREMILRQLKKTPGKSSKKLKNLLPLNLSDYQQALNRLLAEGVVVCNGMSKDHGIASLSLAAPQAKEEHPSSQRETFPRLDEIERTKRFRDAYNSVGGGRPYVYIHKIRNHLQWPDDFFNQTLADLARKDVIVLQGGDPSRLSKQEINDSYQDRSGYLRLTVSWSKER